jgi:hypothetical protein
MPEWGNEEPPELPDWMFSGWFLLLVAILTLACIGIAFNTPPEWGGSTLLAQIPDVNVPDTQQAWGLGETIVACLIGAAIIVFGWRLLSGLGRTVVIILGLIIFVVAFVAPNWGNSWASRLWESSWRLLLLSFSSWLMTISKKDFGKVGMTEWA